MLKALFGSEKTYIVTGYNSHGHKSILTTYTGTKAGMKQEAYNCFDGSIQTQIVEFKLTSNSPATKTFSRSDYLGGRLNSRFI